MFEIKYAEYIVPAFAITGLVFAGMVALSLNNARRWRRRFEELSRKDAKAKVEP